MIQKQKTYTIPRRVVKQKKHMFTKKTKANMCSTRKGNTYSWHLYSKTIKQQKFTAHEQEHSVLSEN